jgi:hypothetical protein
MRPSEDPNQHRPVKTQEGMEALGHNLYLKDSPEPKPPVSSFPGWPNGWIGLAITGRIHESVEETAGPPSSDEMTPSIQPLQPYRTEPDLRVWENIFAHELISHQRFPALRPPEYRNPFHFLDEFDSWFEFMRRTRFEKESACSVIRDMLSHDITRAAESLDTRHLKIQTKRYDFPIHISNEMIEDDREHLKSRIPNEVAARVVEVAAEQSRRKLLDALYTPPFSKEDTDGTFS